jgi:hypothetical protein
MSNQLSTVIALRSHYPTPLGAQHPTFLIAVAKATGAKLLRKDAGSHITLPNGVNVSQDILMFGDQGVDILRDAEGVAGPTWQEKGQILGEYIDVSGLGGDPPPVVTPPTPPVDLSVVLAKLDQIIAQQSHDGALLADMQSNVAHIESVVNALAAQLGAMKAPTYVGHVKLLGQSVTFTLEPQK